MKQQIFSLLVLTLFLVRFLILHPGESSAQCSSGEMTAVYLLDGVLLGQEISIELLNVYEVGEFIFPSEEEMIESLPPSQFITYTLRSSVGPFSFFYCSPCDFGATAIVDNRSGELVFAATTGWWGEGSISVPEFPNRSSSICAQQANGPTEFGVFDNPDWYFHSSDEINEMNVRILAYLEMIDTVVDFENCGEYTLVLHLYSPSGQWLLGNERGVAIISGFCSPLWGNSLVNTESACWGSVKALFR